MEISIKTKKNGEYKIIKEFSKIKSKKEITHIITELEIIKNQLLEIYQNEI